MNKALLEDYMTRTQVAEELNVSVRTLVRWESIKESPPITRIGRNIFYKRSSLQDWINGQESQYASPVGD